MSDNEPVNPDAREWPFSKWYPALYGVIVGILLRFLFNAESGEAWHVMSAAFIYGSPFAIGAVAVYVAERQARRSWRYYAWLGSRANIYAVLASLVILIEGMICAIIIVPVFMLLGAIGGLAMGAICRRVKRPANTAYGIAAMPLVMALILPAGPGELHMGHSMRSTLIEAPPEQVWRQLHNTTAIAPSEVDSAWMYRIGVPLPQSGITRQVGATLERDIRMGKSIYFTQVASEWRENVYVKWLYRFEPDSVPPRALDDHVKIGGDHFDVLDTVYTLTPQGDATLLTISMQYRVTTQFNWYSTRVADLLFNNFEGVILNFYKRRAEAAQALSGASTLPDPRQASAGSHPQAALPPT